jgi:hypothetical protein
LDTPPESPSTRTIHQEVLQNEPALATDEQSAAFATGELSVEQYLIGADNLRR